jgi:hypothetical protein
MSISWGLKERVKFSPGGPLASWVPPQMAAIYSITYRQDPTNKPKAHTVLYFGEASNLREEPPSVHNLLEEIPIEVGASDMFIFIHAMPDSSRFERAALMQSLIGDYRPPGNGY